MNTICICDVFLAMDMLELDQEPPYNLSRNLLLLPRILKLIEDMVDDSTPLSCVRVFLPSFFLQILGRG